jgi:hypothetical protein
LPGGAPVGEGLGRRVVEVAAIWLGRVVEVTASRLRQVIVVTAGGLGQVIVVPLPRRSLGARIRRVDVRTSGRPARVVRMRLPGRRVTATRIPAAAAAALLRELGLGRGVAGLPAAALAWHS